MMVCTPRLISANSRSPEISSVERVVDQEELEHPLLVLLHLGCAGAHHHALGHVHGAGGLELGHLLHFDQAHPADGDRLHLGMRAEDGDVDSDLLGGIQDQRPLGDGDAHAVDLEGDLVGGDGHQATMTRSFRKGHACSLMCCSNSSRKYLMQLRGNQVEASPRGQNERPSMLLPISSSKSASPAFPSPSSIRVST